MTTLDERNIKDHLQNAVDELELAVHAAKEAGLDDNVINADDVAQFKEIINYLQATIDDLIIEENDDE